MYSYLILERGCLIQTGKDRKRSFPREQEYSRSQKTSVPKAPDPFGERSIRLGWHWQKTKLQELVRSRMLVLGVFD